jgi:hypothetical protein
MLAFYCVDDGKVVEVGSPPIMKCIFCCVNFVNNLNPTIKHGKSLITYYKTYGIIYTWMKIML